MVHCPVKVGLLGRILRPQMLSHVLVLAVPAPLLVVLNPAAVDECPPELRHSTIKLTVDSYGHLLPCVGEEAADKRAALIPRHAGRETSGHGSATNSPWDTQKAG